jgi:hypothetical protein
LASYGTLWFCMVSHVKAGADGYGKVMCVMVRRDWLRLGRRGLSGRGVLCHRRFGSVRFRLVWLGWAGRARLGSARYGSVGLG